MAEHPSLVRLARLADGALDATEAESISEHLLVCESCRAAMEGVRGSISRYQKVEDRHRELILASRPSWGARFLPAMVALAALVVAVIAWRGSTRPGDVATAPEAHTDGLRAKGEVTFEVLLSRGESPPTPFSAQQIVLQSGDGLQLRATAPVDGWTFAAIIDSSGAVTPLVPTSTAIPLSAGTSTPFSVRYVVDGKAATEHVITCFGPESFDAAPLLAALRETARPIDGAVLAAKASSFGKWVCQTQSLPVSVTSVVTVADVGGPGSETSP